jgi:ER membrane protein complex subunit 1
VDTVIFHINPLTGEDVSGVERNETSSVLEGIDTIYGALVEAYLIDHQGSKIVLLLDEFLQASLVFLCFSD